MRSKKLIVEDEKQEDFDQLAAGWRAEYGDEGQATKSLLERVISNDWFLQRAERRYMEAEEEAAEAASSSLEWTEEQHHKIELYLRYKTTWERSFYRAFNALRGLRKDKIREEMDLEKVRTLAKDVMQQELAKQQKEALAPVKGKDVFQGQNHPKKQRKIVTLEQFVEVEIKDGRTVTKLYPSNEGLIERGKAMDPPPDLIYRRFNFPNGIPGEYKWTSKPDPGRFERGGGGIQRMTVDTWLEVIAREAARGTGHLGPTGVGNLPRPMERGGCDCEVCSHNRAVMERRAAQAK